MKNRAIRFSHIYPKIYGQTKATLLSVCIAHRSSLNEELVIYDTGYYVDEGECLHYPLPNGLLLVLTFQGDKLIPFTTIRSARGNKEPYYRSCIGKVFDVVIVEDLDDKIKAIQEKMSLDAVS